MGYREDGNFNINWDWDGAAEGKQYAQQNAPFLYPDSGIRFLQGQAALDKAMGRVTTLTQGDYKLHRGYIRNLEQPAWGDVPITRCNFQFNPQQIQQNVAMREDVYLPMLQSPTQLAQPLGANVNFSFDLLFDRSHELAKGNSTTVNPDTDVAISGGGAATADADSIGARDAYDIGVLADLRVFYSVIGQGFSKEMIDFQAKMFEYNAIKEMDSTTNQPTGGESGGGATTDGTTSESADVATPPTSQAGPNATEIEQLINSNIGNFALLMPMPVRVVFSSLFMVDGFVTSTSVDFLKFSTKMVPVQCRIGLSMNALYIGFARQTTYLTDVFNRAAEDMAARRAEEEAARRQLLEALNRTCRSFIIGAALEQIVTGYVVDWDRAASLSHTREFPVWALAVSEDVTKGGQRFKNLFFGFPQIKPNKGGDANTTRGGETTLVREGADDDAILSLYEPEGGGLAINFSYTWSIQVSGRIPGSNQKAPLTQALAIKYKDGKMSAAEIAQEEIKVLGTYSATETSTSKAEWGHGTSSPGSDAERIRRRSRRGDAVVNTATGAYKKDTFNFDYGDVVDWGEASYFIVEISVDFSVSVNGGTPITASYSSTSVKKGDEDFDRKILVNWDGGSITSDDPPSMPIGTIGNPGVI